ncbi:Alpha/Beta hydrolase protein [Mycena polygramma]|nr:Alpha/Beta hydrolase protein [Mycena polygramma]
MSCPNCFLGSVLEGEPTGVISEIEGAYFASGGPDASNKRAIILLTDIFGLPLNNSKLLADNFAKHLKCDVWIPDLFAGKPPVTVKQMDILPDRAGVKFGFFSILKLISRVWTSIPSLLIFNRSSVVDARTVSVVKKLQEQKKYEKFGAIGYCFGGGVASRLGASTDLFSSIILVHPSPVSDAQLKAIKAPTAWSMPEDDMGISPARVNEIEAFYEGRRGKDTFVDYEVKVYKGTAHGFGARPNFAYPEVKEGFEKAFQQAVDWFNKTIPA